MPGQPTSRAFLATDLPHQRLLLDHTQALAAAQRLLSGSGCRMGHGLCIGPSLILSVAVLQAPCSVPCVEEREAREAKLGIYSLKAWGQALGKPQSAWRKPSPCLLTDGWPSAGHLVLQVEGILVGGDRGVGDGAQVLHGKAA